MKNKIVIFILCLSSNLIGQHIDFNIVVLDTSEHFNPSPYSNARFDSNLIIDHDSIFKEVFYWSPFTVGRPKFKEAIWLKRSIHGSCLSNIKNTVTIDSIKRTVTWNASIQSQNCKSKETRHIVIQIPTPPANYDILFDTTLLKNKTNLNEINSTIIDDLEVSFFHCAPFVLPRYIDSKRTVIHNDSLFTAWNKKEMNCEKPDFKKNLILAKSYGGDCHMRLMPHPFFDPITNTLVLNVYNIWGGCRAGGRKSIVILVEKPKEQFSVVFQEIQLESWSEYEQHIKHTKNVDNKK